MPITFGSFGDIIAAVQVAYKLLEVLSAQRGAKREFWDLIVDLRLFHRFLDQLLSFWQTREQCPLLDNLYDILQSVICDAKGEISALLEKIISKYGRSLTSPFKRNPKDVGKMLQWHLSERDGIARLQEKLRKSKEVIMMVQGQANTIAEERNRVLVDEKMSALMDAEAEAMTKLDKRLDHLEETAERQTELLNRIYNCIGSVSSAIVPIASAALDVPTMLAKIYAELLAQRAVARSLNPYAQNSALVEDALGWTFQIPLEVVVSWNTLHSILLDRFANSPGRRLVKGRRYVMRDDLNGMELRQNMSLNLVLRPGQKINMCMVYFSAQQQMMVCPKCKASTFYANDTDFTCLEPKCGMQIQRIEEIVDVENIEESLKATTALMTSEDDSYVNVQPDSYEIEPEHLALSFPAEDGPEIFKRIRYVTRWEYRSESRGKLFYNNDQYSLWYAKCVEAMPILMALDSSLDCTLPDYIPRKKYRKEAWRHSKEIDWIKANPFLLVLTTSSSIFHKSVKKYCKSMKAI
ncbi:hypothetical protein EJ04DRAFT_555303 [Polyplosphaeria fusca]|uniref:Ubiquitin-like domain-containing protein n=1 Tax=Polyplosphaeria fusca TaxID=682080 RepID=A0A9P4QQH8_9PLEO|nr:hypothetical protein EJ04DRAFT_555303 [Polyplosphaeria fusca]